MWVVGFDFGGEFDAITFDSPEPAIGRYYWHEQRSFRELPAIVPSLRRRMKCFRPGFCLSIFGWPTRTMAARSVLALIVFFVCVCRVCVFTGCHGIRPDGLGGWSLFGFVHDLGGLASNDFFLCVDDGGGCRMWYFRRQSGSIITVVCVFIL